MREVNYITHRTTAQSLIFDWVSAVVLCPKPRRRWSPDTSPVTIKHQTQTVSQSIHYGSVGLDWESVLSSTPAAGLPDHQYWLHVKSNDWLGTPRNSYCILSSHTLILYLLYCFHFQVPPKFFQVFSTKYLLLVSTHTWHAFSTFLCGKLNMAAKERETNTNIVNILQWEL